MTMFLISLGLQLFALLWIFTGFMVVLCATVFLGVKPSNIRIIVRMLFWPWFMSKDAWKD